MRRLRASLCETAESQQDEDGQLQQTDAAVEAGGHQSPLGAPHRLSGLLVLHRSRAVLGKRRPGALELSTHGHRHTPVN